MNIVDFITKHITDLVINLTPIFEYGEKDMWCDGGVIDLRFEISRAHQQLSIYIDTIDGSTKALYSDSITSTTNGEIAVSTLTTKNRAESTDCSLIIIDVGDINDGLCEDTEALMSHYINIDCLLVSKEELLLIRDIIRIASL